MKTVIHFGIHRTGSTSIQETLEKSRDRLLENGYLYPLIDGRAYHVTIPWRLNSGEIAPQQIWSSIKEQLTSNIHTIVLSAEDFCTLRTMSQLKELVPDAELHGVVYLRRQDLWLESWYNQHIKWPWNGNFSSNTPQEFLQKIHKFGWIDYSHLLRRLTKVIKREQLYIQVMGPGGASDTVSDFFDHLAVKSEWLTPSVPKNESISSIRLSLIRAIDILELSQKGRLQIINAIRELDIPEDDGQKHVFSPRQRRKILKTFDRSNRRVAKDFFERNDLFENVDKMPPKPAVLSNAKIYEVYIPAILKKVAEKIDK